MCVTCYFSARVFFCYFVVKSVIIVRLFLVADASDSEMVVNARNNWVFSYG